jgi:hypothetical protein
VVISVSTVCEKKCVSVGRKLFVCVRCAKMCASPYLLPREIHFFVSVSTAFVCVISVSVVIFKGGGRERERKTRVCERDF